MAYGIDSERAALGVLHQCRIYWQGFESSVARLLSSGWKMQSDRHPYEYDVRVALTNTDLRLVAMFPDQAMMEQIPMDIHIRQVVAADNRMIVQQEISHFIPLVPSLREGLDFRDVQMRQFRLADMFDFEKPQQLIVEPEDVQSLLSRIVEMQRPKQKEIRVENAKQARKTQAQIVSLIDWKATA